MQAGLFRVKVVVPGIIAIVPIALYTFFSAKAKKAVRVAREVEEQKSWSVLRQDLHIESCDDAYLAV